MPFIAWDSDVEGVDVSALSTSISVSPISPAAMAGASLSATGLSSLVLAAPTTLATAPASSAGSLLVQVLISAGPGAALVLPLTIQGDASSISVSCLDGTIESYEALVAAGAMAVTVAVRAPGVASVPTVTPATRGFMAATVGPAQPVMGPSAANAVVASLIGVAKACQSEVLATSLLAESAAVAVTTPPTTTVTIPAQVAARIASMALLPLGAIGSTDVVITASPIILRLTPGGAVASVEGEISLVKASQFRLGVSVTTTVDLRTGLISTVSTSTAFAASATLGSASAILPEVASFHVRRAMICLVSPPTVSMPTTRQSLATSPVCEMASAGNPSNGIASAVAARLSQSVSASLRLVSAPPASGRLL